VKGHAQYHGLRTQLLKNPQHLLHHQRLDTPNGFDGLHRIEDVRVVEPNVESGSKFIHFGDFRERT
jgi:hypothetical protein